MPRFIFIGIRIAKLFLLTILYNVFRVGRTARSGKSGRAVTFVTQYDVEALQQLERLLEFKLPEVSLTFFVSVHNFYSLH
jgi:superfamily II DNA/RNA helicase